MCSSLYATLVDPFLRDIRLFVPGFAGMKAGDRALDVGCGTGDQALHYAARGIEAYGIDIDPVMIAQADRSMRKRRLKAFFSVQDAAALSFEDGSFDFVTTTLALHEKDAGLQDAVLSEMRRVTREGGSLVLVDFSVPLPRNAAGLFMRSVEFLVGGEHYRNFRGFKGSGGLDGLLKRNGLEPQKAAFLKSGAITALKVAA